VWRWDGNHGEYIIRIHINSQPLSPFLGWLVSKTDVKKAYMYVIPDITHAERPLTVFSNPGLERVSTFQGVNCRLEIKSKLNQQSSSGEEDLHNFSASL